MGAKAMAEACDAPFPGRFATPCALIVATCRLESSIVNARDVLAVERRRFGATYRDERARARAGHTVDGRPRC